MSTRYPGRVGKHDKLGKQWARDYRLHFESLEDAVGDDWQPLSLAMREQIAWVRSVPSEATSYFGSTSCLGCGRDIVEIDGTLVCQGAAGGWAKAVRGLCMACYMRAYRSGELELMATSRR